MEANTIKNTQQHCEEHYKPIISSSLTRWYQLAALLPPTPQALFRGLYDIITHEGWPAVCLLIVLQPVTTQHDVTRVKETHSGPFLSIGTMFAKKYILLFAAEKVIVNPDMSTRFKKYL